MYLKGDTEMIDLTFKAIEGDDGQREGEDGWQVFADDKLVCDKIKDTDIANVDICDILEQIGVKVNFDYD